MPATSVILHPPPLKPDSVYGSFGINAGYFRNPSPDTIEILTRFTEVSARMSAASVILHPPPLKPVSIYGSFGMNAGYFRNPSSAAIETRPNLRKYWHIFLPLP
jgi:hypothetical protein